MWRERGTFVSAMSLRLHRLLPPQSYDPRSARSPISSTDPRGSLSCSSGAYVSRGRVQINVILITF